MFKKEQIITTLKDRGFLGAFLVSALVFLLIIILSAIFIRPSDIQVPLYYTAFGITNIYRSQWYYELAFPLFGALLFVMNTLVGVRLYEKKNRNFGIAYQWLTAIMLGISLFVMIAVFRVISIVQ